MSLLLQKCINHEFTTLPQIFKSIFGNYYNNASCNACCLCFFLWFILHLGFDFYVNNQLTKFGFKKYKRTRLKKSLWNVLFYGLATYACLAILTKSNVVPLVLIQLIDLNLAVHRDVNYLNTELMVVVSFCLHTAFWEIGEQDGLKNFYNSVVMALLIIFSSFLRISDLAFLMFAIYSTVRLAVEMAKMMHDLANEQSKTILMFTAVGFFIIGQVYFAIIFLIGIPLLYLIPLAKHLLILTQTSLPMFNLTFLFFSTMWYVNELYSSSLLKLILHWQHHNEKSFKCKKSMVECSLFPKRDDAEYQLKIIQKEIRKRTMEEKSRKFSNRRVTLMQIIYCNMKINKKIRARRLAKQAMEETSICRCTENGNQKEDKSVDDFVNAEVVESLETALDELHLQSVNAESVQNFIKIDDSCQKNITDSRKNSSGLINLEDFSAINETEFCEEVKSVLDENLNADNNTEK